eukprot:TRINITY_DN7578_c0_g1_i1.p1 TRINITY_DN7578_c0_g1~~TRINITY_DN7578_c0_g1_i1.p1  ORF type:complete len:389 (-),score=61.98 TRINITY_DN7578_c0_g1_i1:44-1087(-)
MSGFTLTNDKYCPNVTFDSEKGYLSLEYLISTGADWISVVVTQYQKKFNSTEIFAINRTSPIYGPYYTYETASDDSIKNIINKAHNRGLKVMIKPQIDLTEDDKFWRGDIGINFTSTQWDQWFNSYTNMIMRYIEIAEEHNVEMFSVSCELIEASHQEKHWRELVSKIRGKYHGIVTNSANWGYLNATGGEETNITYWDIFDVIGVDAYYPLNISNTTLDVNEISLAWKPIIERLYNLSVFWNRKVLLTEIGYCSGDCTRGHNSSTFDQLRQAALYHGSFRAMEPYRDWFLGYFWWAWSTDPAQGGLDDNCIGINMKPAEDVVRYFYQTTHAKIPPPPFPAVCACTV